MTGANFAVADTGECVVCTNEGNADMGTSLCTKRLQITAFGLEKIVPNRQALGVFTRLLARSATGQPSTAYTSHYRSPRQGGELHIIIVDNGRSQLLADASHRRVLNCLRCGTGMQFIRREKFQLGQTGWVLGDLPNLFAGAMEIEIYVCPKCGKLEFFQPGSDKFAGTADEAKTGSGYLPPDAPGGLPRKKCPVCGAVLDFDYGRCPYCEHEF